MRKSQKISSNSIRLNPKAAVLYVDMNSFFASCEQQVRPELRGKPIGVCSHDSPFAAVIAPSAEAKKYGVKTGMRLSDCRQLCPDITPVVSNPVLYRRFHIAIMDVLRSYCGKDVLAKSIDEAAIDLSSYRLVYKDFLELGRNIKKDIMAATEKVSGVEGQYVKCSVGIAPNTFLAKLGTELQKPDGLVEITPDNIDTYLARLKLTDLPGIARSNARRLETIGLHSPLDMRYASEALLRKAFGGITGHYWHARLNFGEVDFYTNDYRAMSATRTVSSKQRASYDTLFSLFIALCNRLEQRLVKQKVFCRQASFFIRYHNNTSWDTHVRFPDAVQDALEIRQYLMHNIRKFEQDHRIETMFNNQVKGIGVAIMDFLKEEHVAYGLFDNRMKQDQLRKVMYNIKDQYGKYKVRRASETVQKSHLNDAIGFGSVKDLYADAENHKEINQFLLEETDE